MSPEEELRFLILGAQREGNRMLAERLAPLGLTPSQAEVLHCLAIAGPLSLNALGRLLVCEAGSPSRLVDTLVGRTLVERTENPVDRRQVTLRLTSKGKRLALDAAKVEDELHGWIRQRLEAGGVSTAVKQMRRLVSGTTAGHAVARRKAASAER
jgi:DNA-binding MarR family transcriptional regulator